MKGLYAKKLVYLFSPTVWYNKRCFYPQNFLPCDILLVVLVCYGRYFPFNESTEEGFWKLLSCLNRKLHYEIVYFILHDFMSHLVIMFNACVTIMLSNRNAVLILMKLYKTLLMYCHNREETACKLYLIKPLFVFIWVPHIFFNCIFHWHSVSNNFHDLWKVLSFFDV